MPKRQQFFSDMQGENRQLALLLAQVGAMPSELQLILQVAEYDESAGGLRPIRGYIVRVLGVEEHRLSTFGTTTPDVTMTTDHPLLYGYNQPPCALFFRGTPRDAHELALDIAQAHASTFRGWREFPEYIDLSQPLHSLLTGGGGLLGQMPINLAENLAKMLEAHGLETKLMMGEHREHTSPLKDQQMTAFIFGKSYVLSYAFSFEEMVGKK